MKNHCEAPSALPRGRDAPRLAASHLFWQPASYFVALVHAPACVRGEGCPCCCKPLISALPGAASAQQHPVSTPCQQKWSGTALPVELVGTWEGWGPCMGQPGPKAAGFWCFLQSVEVTELLLKVPGDVLVERVMLGPGVHRPTSHLLAGTAGRY